jgi:hypothetical protein
MKTVKENEAVNSRCVELHCEVRKRGEARRKFGRDGNSRCLLYLANNLDHLGFDFRSAHRGVTRRVIKIQFDRVRSSLFQQTRVRCPTTARRAVERGNHRNRNSGFHPLQVLEVFVGPGRQ